MYIYYRCCTSMKASIDDVKFLSSSLGNAGDLKKKKQCFRFQSQQSSWLEKNKRNKNLYLLVLISWCSQRSQFLGNRLGLTLSGCCAPCRARHIGHCPLILNAYSKHGRWMGWWQYLVIVQLYKFGEIGKRQTPHNKSMASRSGCLPCNRLDRRVCTLCLVRHSGHRALIRNAFSKHGRWMGWWQYLVIVQLYKFAEIDKRQTAHNKSMASRSGCLPCNRLDRLVFSAMLISLRREKHC